MIYEDMKACVSSWASAQNDRQPRHCATVLDDLLASEDLILRTLLCFLESCQHRLQHAVLKVKVVDLDSHLEQFIFWIGMAGTCLLPHGQEVTKALLVELRLFSGAARKKLFKPGHNDVRNIICTAWGAASNNFLCRPCKPPQGTDDVVVCLYSAQLQRLLAETLHPCFQQSMDLSKLNILPSWVAQVIVRGITWRKGFITSHADTIGPVASSRKDTREHGGPFEVNPYIEPPVQSAVSTFIAIS